MHSTLQSITVYRDTIYNRALVKRTESALSKSESDPEAAQNRDKRNAFASGFAGSGTFRNYSSPRAVLTERVEKSDTPPVYDVGNHSLVLFDRGDEISVQAGDEGIRFLLVSGKPIEEPVAWYGPIVMNTQEQLREAMEELQDGSFIKHR